MRQSVYPASPLGSLGHGPAGAIMVHVRNCGTSADLLLNVEDVEVLAMAAGGYGAASAKQGGAFWRVAGSAQ